MARHAAEGDCVTVAVLTKGSEPRFREADIAQTRKEVKAAHDLLGVVRTIFMDLPACALDTVPHGDVNAALVEVMRDVTPDVLYLPFVGDIHLDHQLAFLSALVASRPPLPFAATTILAYETVSETHWNAPYVTPPFVPNVYVDISDYLQRKLDAMRAIPSQVQEFPHERSLKALEALATLRGATVSRRAAESFVLIRQVI